MYIHALTKISREYYIVVSKHAENSFGLPFMDKGSSGSMQGFCNCKDISQNNGSLRVCMLCSRYYQA